MLDLGKMRDEIDVIDSEIVRLFEKRMKICENVAQFKIETGKPVFDKASEQDKLKTLGAKAGSAILPLWSGRTIPADYVPSAENVSISFYRKTESKNQAILQKLFY